MEIFNSGHSDVRFDSVKSDLSPKFAGSLVKGIQSLQAFVPRFY